MYLLKILGGIVISTEGRNLVPMEGKISHIRSRWHFYDGSYGCDLRAMWRPKVAAAPSRCSGGSQASATFRAFQHSLSC
ncbi:hypothetical protein AUK22_08245 [bacterium CG2_30_54_10]|nr:MAG: hypothetical protein AUK22_08245 [bacterium CG2_30_54_10]